MTPQQPTPGIRPIVVGEAIMRQTGRVMVLTNSVRFRTFFQPYQFGVGVPGGAEQIIHSTRLAVQAHPGWVVFQADLSNAFNTISRTLILNELFEQGFHDMIPYYFLNYGQSANLSLRLADGSTAWFSSCEGVHRGDPVAPFFFFGTTSCVS